MAQNNTNMAAPEKEDFIDFALAMFALRREVTEYTSQLEKIKTSASHSTVTQLSEDLQKIGDKIKEMEQRNQELANAFLDQK